ncbi:MAG TPA: MEDS domain-containing protein [Acidimicrobiia bacterium]|nr:MEDS domain-containing protein [Acidimicrobiia bacterium]
MALTTERVLGAPHDHVVQFYGHDHELVDAVVPHLAVAVRSGGVAIAIATRAHHRLFAARFEALGVDVAAAEAAGTLRRLDADEAMAALLIDGRLAPHRFDKIVGEQVRDAATAGRPVRAYGEIVARMWAAGHVTAALELEGLWNGLGLEVDFSLYCAYPLATVEGGGDADAFHEVCRQHSAVVGAPVALPRLEGATLELARTFVRVGRGPADARRFVVDTLTAWGHADLVDDAAVITTELATNAVIHARTDFTVTISRLPGGAIRVAVRDASPAPPRPRHARPLSNSGRGLSLVEALATGWGAELQTDGKVVWAQFG